MFVDALPIAGPLLLAALINLVAAVVTAGSRPRRAVGVVLSLVSMTPPWLVPAEHSLFRATWVVITFVGFARTVDLTRGVWSLPDRLVHVVSVVDTRKLTRARPAFALAAFLQFVAWELLAWPLYHSIGFASRWTGAPHWAFRWLAALAYMYALTAGAYPLLFFAYRAIGFITPRLHINPAASRSVQEFWGERWNRTIGAWLSETFFRPLARRRHPVIGSFAAFTASAVVHAYIEWVSVTWAMALVVLAYFVSQAVVIGLERVFRVRTWPPWAGHAWAIAWMVGLSPLFTEPALWAFGV